MKRILRENNNANGTRAKARAVQLDVAKIDTNQRKLRNDLIEKTRDKLMAMNPRGTNSGYVFLKQGFVNNRLQKIKKYLNL